MSNKISTVAFDLGGVLAHQDLSVLTEEERFILKTYMNRKKITDKELIVHAESKIANIYSKIHKLSPEAVPTLEMLREEKIRPSIWTNNIKEIDNWFEEIGLYRHIKREDIINSFYIGADKPEVEFFRKALELLKNKPQDVLFLDDSKENVTSAKNYGINSRMYNMRESLEDTVRTEIRK